MKETKLSQKDMKYIDALVKERVAKKIPHICTYCDQFQFNEGHKTNRYCQFKGKLKIIRGVCQRWGMAEDVGLRVRGNYTV